MFRSLTLYYALISGESLKLSLEEFRAVMKTLGYAFEELFKADGIVVFKTRGRVKVGEIVDRAAYTKEIGLFLGVWESSESCVRRLVNKAQHTLENVAMNNGASRVWVDTERRGPYEARASTSKASSSILAIARSLGLRPDRRDADVRFRVFATEGVIVLGMVLAVQEKRGYIDRSPGRRPFFKPGPLSPRLSRAFVNLARLGTGQTFLDPFCGTGGFAIEACLLGASRVLCGDLDWKMVRGGPLNLARYCRPGVWAYAAWNAARLPLHNSAVDAIATDPPYGRSTTTGGMGYSTLVKSFLKNSIEVLRSGGRVVFAGPVRRNPEKIAESVGLRVESRIEMFVHGSLTRSIVVARVE